MQPTWTITALDGEVFHVTRSFGDLLDAQKAYPEDENPNPVDRANLMLGLQCYQALQRAGHIPDGLTLQDWTYTIGEIADWQDPTAAAEPGDGSDPLAANAQGSLE